ncbi:hypothetical protein V7794_30755 [Rhizobium laguerreae]
MIENDDLPTVSEIAGAALEFLKAQTGSEDGIYLSRLGGMLSQHFRRPTRELLGKRKLSQILKDGLGDAVKIEGSETTLAAKLVAESEMSGGVVRFDPVIWAAFSKPLTLGKVRYLKATRPFTFVSDIDKLTWEEPKEIREGDIADAALPKSERDREITHKIDEWCAQNNLHPSAFKYEPLSNNRPAKAAPKHDVLRTLVEAVPAEKRKNFSLQFDLIYELLDK